MYVVTNIGGKDYIYLHKGHITFQTNIDNLNIQVDQFESEIETLQARRKKLDRDVSMAWSQIYFELNVMLSPEM